MGLGVGRHNLKTFGTLTHPKLLLKVLRKVEHIPKKEINIFYYQFFENNFIQQTLSGIVWSSSALLSSAAALVTALSLLSVSIKTSAVSFELFDG